MREKKRRKKEQKTGLVQKGLLRRSIREDYLMKVVRNVLSSCRTERSWRLKAETAVDFCRLAPSLFYNKGAWLLKDSLPG